MPHQLTHAQNLPPRLIERAHRVELLDTKAFGLEQFTRRALGKATGDNEVRLQHQHVFRLAGELWKTRSLGSRPRPQRIARVRAEAGDLLGIGKRQQ